MFLHLGWGGAYMDREATTANIRNCFSVADRIVEATQSVEGFNNGKWLTVVGSDFYGSYWLLPGKRPRNETKDEGRKRPLEMLNEVLTWLGAQPRKKTRPR